MRLTKYQIKQEILATLKAGQKPGINEAMLITSHSLLEARDKTGAPYALHWTTVAFDGTHSDIKRQIGILHDVIEDTDWTIEDLEELGFDPRVIRGVKAMTRDEENNEDYFSFIERCSHDSYGLDVKLNDLRHNLDQSRNNFIPGPNDLMRIQKYILSYQYLVSVKQGDIKPGTPIEEFAAKFFADDKNYDLLGAVMAKEGRQLLPPNRPPQAKQKFGALLPS